MVPEYALFYKESRPTQSLSTIERIFAAKRACALDYNLWEEVRKLKSKYRQSQLASNLSKIEYNKDVDLDDLEDIQTDQDHESSFLHFYDPYDRHQGDDDFGDDSREDIDAGIEEEYGQGEGEEEEV